MKNIVGTKNQEEKIAAMGEIAHGLFPDISIMSFKGSFRYGIGEALEKLNYENWADLVDRSQSEKEQFFKTIFEFSAKKWNGIGLSDAQIQKLAEALNSRRKEFISG